MVSRLRNAGFCSNFTGQQRSHVYKRWEKFMPWKLVGEEISTQLCAPLRLISKRKYYFLFIILHQKNKKTVFLIIKNNYIFFQYFSSHLNHLFSSNLSSLRLISKVFKIKSTAEFTRPHKLNSRGPVNSAVVLIEKTFEKMSMTPAQLPTSHNIKPADTSKGKYA